jgi:hypothetical protein
MNVYFNHVEKKESTREKKCLKEQNKNFIFSNPLANEFDLSIKRK